MDMTTPFTAEPQSSQSFLLSVERPENKNSHYGRKKFPDFFHFKN